MFGIALHIGFKQNERKMPHSFGLPVREPSNRSSIWILLSKPNVAGKRGATTGGRNPRCCEGFGLLIRKGRLSETLLMKARGMPSTTTLRAHFGTFRKLYEMVGYHLDTEDILKREQCKRSLKLRRKVVSKIKEMFPE